MPQLVHPIFEHFPEPVIAERMNYSIWTVLDYSHGYKKLTPRFRRNAVLTFCKGAKAALRDGDKAKWRMLEAELFLPEEEKP